MEVECPVRSVQSNRNWGDPDYSEPLEQFSVHRGKHCNTLKERIYSLISKSNLCKSIPQSSSYSSHGHSGEQPDLSCPVLGT